MGDAVTQPSTQNKIEMAMGRVTDLSSSEASEPDTIPADTRSTWRREQDRALKLRLEQLQVSMGHGQAAIPTIAASSTPTATQAPARAQTFPSERSARSYGIGTFLSVALFGALSGASLMWIAINSSTQSTSPLAATSAAPVKTATPAIVVAAAVAPVNEPIVAAPEPKPAVQVDASESQARDLIEGWRQAWENRDAGNYVKHYSQGFTPANGQARSKWAEGRQRNFSGKSSIQVSIGGMRLERLTDDRIKAFFLQDYTADNYRESAKPKTLLLERAGQEWKIAGEWEGDYAITPQATQ